MSPIAVIVLAGFVLVSQAGPPPQSKTAASPAQASRPIAAVQTPGATPGWQTIKPGITSVEQDNGIDQPSGAIYSTGAEDVVIKILDPMRARRPIIIQRLPPMPASPFISGIYLFSPGPGRLLGGSLEIGKVVNLGKLPPGQLVFGVKTGDGYTLFANDPAKNPDRLDHGITRTFKSGIREIWFEDAPGPCIPTGAIVISMMPELKSVEGSTAERCPAW